MKVIMALFIIIPVSLKGQIEDDFEDSSAARWIQSDYGRWEASAFSPLNGRYSLHHVYDNPDAGHDQVSIGYDALLLDSATAIWRFKIRHGYNTSSNNNWGFFLVSDKNSSLMFPGTNVNGYVLGVNYTGNDDLVKLWKTTSGKAHELANTYFNWQENAGTEKNVGFEVSRDSIGWWTIRIDTSRVSNNFITIGKVMDSEHRYSLFSGIYYKYSATQDQKLWFDDLHINGYFYDDSLSLLYHDPLPFDIVITEIMADPLPPVMLPPCEYIELFNRSDYDIYLSGWDIISGNSQAALPGFTVKSKGYAVVTGYGNSLDIGNPSAIIYVEGFPVLNNAGQTITLSDKNNSVIHSITYSDKWYKPEYKSEGGWSLEIIDMANPCGKGGNWTASSDTKGGTPGKVNSAAGHNPDKSVPVVRRTAVVSDSLIQIYFNESLCSLSLTNRKSYFVENGIGYPAYVNPVQPDFASIKLGFDKSFDKEVLYTIKLDSTIKDCAGNALKDNTRSVFAMPKAADSLDIVINEVLFNTSNNGTDFVELYNRSKKLIDLQNFCIASGKLFSEKTIDYNPFTGEHFPLFPGEYAVISADTAILRHQYSHIDASCMIQSGTLTSLPDNEGIIIITDDRLNILDELHYCEDIHFKLLSSSEGVSLERIYSDRPTNDPNNWHSASEDCGFATPGARNSQHSDFEPAQKKIEVYPEVFSPDNDGHNDYVNVYYNLGEPGSVASIIVFDYRGCPVKYLARNTMLGTEGVFIWDGTNENNMRASIGIYLIYTEIFDLNGKVYKFKNTCVLALKI
jgi:hypothetical protein